MKNAFRLLLLSVLFVACGEADTAIYDGSSSNQTIYRFDSDFYTLPVKINETGTVDITIQSSTVSDEDRVVNIARVDEVSTASEDVYELPSSVTIPAGEYFGTFTVQGMDVNLDAPQSLVIEFTPNDESIITDRTRATIKIEEVCPIIRDEFLGTYTGTELPGPYTYENIVTAGAGPNDLIISNVWEAGATAKTKISLSGDQFDGKIIWPPYTENFLYVNATYGDAFVEPFHPTGLPSTVDACTKTITLYFRVRVSAGTFTPNTLTMVKQ